MGLSIAHRGESFQPKPLPAPEEVFLAWLLRRQQGEDLRAAADREICTLRRYEGAHPGPRLLITLFEEFRETLPFHHEGSQ